MKRIKISFIIILILHYIFGLFSKGSGVLILYSIQTYFHFPGVKAGYILSILIEVVFLYSLYSKRKKLLKIYGACKLLIGILSIGVPFVLYEGNFWTLFLELFLPTSSLIISYFILFNSPFKASSIPLNDL